MADNDVSVNESPEAQSRARKAAFAGGFGTLIEWYDYGLYGLASALYITPLFFSGSSPFIGTLLTFMTFAVGFAARPLGGFVLGHLGDRWGRKPVLLMSVIMMGVSTVLMGLLPTGATVGALAPILLIVLRLIQGFGAGAELAGAFVYVSESTPANRRGFYTSFTGASMPAGALIATLLFLALENTLSPEAMLSWGWRVPFLFAAVGLVAAVIVRSRLEEAPGFEEAKRSGQRSRVPILDMFRADPRAFFSGLLTPTIIGVGAYVTTVFGLNYVRNNLEMDPTVALIASLVSTSLAIFTILLFGKWVDRWGSHKVFLFGSLFSIVMAFPFFIMLNTKNPVLIVLAITLNYSIAWGAVACSQGRLLPSLFDLKHRFSGVAVTREINSAALAGPAPMIAVALVSLGNGQPWLVAIMLVLAGLLSVVGVGLGWKRASADASGQAAD